MLLLDRIKWTEMKLDLLIGRKLAINAIRLLCVGVFCSNYILLWLTGRAKTAIVKISRTQI